MFILHVVLASLFLYCVLGMPRDCWLPRLELVGRSFCGTLHDPKYCIESHAALTRSFRRLLSREQEAKLCRTSRLPVNKLSGAMNSPCIRRPGTESRKLVPGGTMPLP